MDDSKIKETLKKQLQLLSERKKRKPVRTLSYEGNEDYAIKRSLVILSITLLIQSILLLRLYIQIREICSILALLTERLNLLM